MDKRLGVCIYGSSDSSELAQRVKPANAACFSIEMSDESVTPRTRRWSLAVYVTNMYCQNIMVPFIFTLIYLISRYML